MRVAIGEWKDDKQMKKGISLTLARWKNSTDYLEYLDQTLTYKRTITVFCEGMYITPLLRVWHAWALEILEAV